MKAQDLQDKIKTYIFDNLNERGFDCIFSVDPDDLDHQSGHLGRKWQLAYFTILSTLTIL